MAPPEEPKKPKKSLKLKKKQKVEVITPKVSVPKFRLVWVLVVVLAALSIFLYAQYQTAQNKIEDAKSGKSSQANDVIKSVSKIVIVPSDETPTVATVTNAEKINNQEFFASAKNGDKVLVYGKQKKAILYRPSTNQIVNINTVTAIQGASPAN